MCSESTHRETHRDPVLGTQPHGNTSIWANLTVCICAHVCVCIHVWLCLYSCVSMCVCVPQYLSTIHQTFSPPLSRGQEGQATIPEEIAHPGESTGPERGLVWISTDPHTVRAGGPPELPSDPHRGPLMGPLRCQTPQAMCHVAHRLSWRLYLAAPA